MSDYIKYEVKVFPNGNKSWYLNGKCHREDGPAVEYADGSKIWYKNGKCHRIDGPACEFACGEKYWCLNGINYTEAEFKKKIAKNSKAPCEGKIIEVDLVRALDTYYRSRW